MFKLLEGNLLLKPTQNPPISTVAKGRCFPRDQGNLDLSTTHLSLVTCFQHFSNLRCLLGDVGINHQSKEVVLLFGWDIWVASLLFGHSCQPKKNLLPQRLTWNLKPILHQEAPLKGKFTPPVTTESPESTSSQTSYGRFFYKKISQIQTTTPTIPTTIPPGVNRASPELKQKVTAREAQGSGPPDFSSAKLPSL